MRLVGALGVMLGVALLPAAAGGQSARSQSAGGQSAGGQSAGDLAAGGPSATGRVFEGFYTRVGYDGGGRTVRAGGLGGRVMWPLGAGPEAADAAAGATPRAGSGVASWLARRTAVGLFGAVTPEQQLGFTAGQFGVAADLTPFAAPIGGRVEPFVSLGAGALRTTERDAEFGPRPVTRPEMRVGAGRGGSAARGARSATDFLLVPAVGARVRLRPGVAAQGDVRNLVAFRGDARRHHPAFGTGVRLAF
jgi:hypothetical protein